ncbi:response regulator with CheY-like receiver domain and winged-helix DNA-binding domain [Terriglobus roseus DSM 18391]|uniref:Response regulator with CheY-like receiver domain and winged-helix DNA-binding domain n=1 Tax=Terriglobus roseus (strain DSM 18391 / NRRL B-41598 / KBS 63) TaxID=926566 RepID=I3ZJ43_TERRK|nr:response regulator with CheY-like receiver domain and winged-helix DNA-binding domain [Terriglobus roseus DSM 18391]
MLLRAPGELVSRDLIRTTLWGGTYTDHEHGINTAIRKLRESIERKGRNAVSIQTVSGKGYRLLLPLADRASWSAPGILELQLVPGYLDEKIRQRLHGLLGEIAGALSQTTKYRAHVQAGAPTGELLLKIAAQQWNEEILLTAQLTEVENDEPLWSDTYRFDLLQSLAVQLRLVRDIVTALTALPKRRSPAERSDCMARTLAEPSILDPVGYEAYLDGRFLFAQRSPRSLSAARTRFEVACELNPDFAFAHASLSRTCRFLTIFETGEPGHLWRLAEHHACRAVELDPRISEAQSSLACVQARYQWRWLDGCAAYEEALRLNPSDPETYCDYGVALLAMGEFNEGARCLERVLALDPRYAVGRATVALGRLMQGRRSEAVAMLEGMTEAMPDFLTPWIYLGIDQLNTEHWAKAEVSFLQALRLAPDNPTFVSLLSQAYAGQNRMEDAVRAVGKLSVIGRDRYVSPTARAVAAMAVRDDDAALLAVECVVNERDANFALYRRMRVLDPIREHPVFIATLQAMDLQKL